MRPFVGVAIGLTRLYERFSGPGAADAGMSQLLSQLDLRAGLSLRL